MNHEAKPHCEKETVTHKNHFAWVWAERGIEDFW